MIEPTEQQLQAIRECLADYDDSPWTDEEMDALAWEAGKHAGWDDMGEYDDERQPEDKAG